MNEIINGIYEIHAFNSSNFFSQKIIDSVKQRVTIGIHFSTLLPLFFQGSQLLVSSLMALILYYCGVKIIDGSMTFGKYVLLIEYAQLILTPFLTIANTITTVKPSIILLKRVLDFFKTAGTKKDISQNSNCTHNPAMDINALTLEHISYCYPRQEKTVVSDFNLRAQKNEIILIKGKNGSGKSTILNVLLGELEGYEGKIFLDGLPIKSRECFGLVAQKPYIFSLSLKDNIVLQSTYDDKRYNDVIKELRFNEYFDKAIMNGKVIAENEKSLSGGQIKLIALARCVYCDKPILLLDEVFSNLDDFLCATVTKYILIHKREHITIMIEHGEKYERIADKIIVT